MIKSIRVQGFKSIKDSGVVKLSPRLSVLVGFNAAGKTNLISAISFTQRVLRGAQPEAAAKRFSLILTELFYKGDVNHGFSIELTVSDKEENLFYRYEYKMKLKESGDNTHPRFIVESEKLENSADENGGFKVVYERIGNKVTDSQGKSIPLNVEETSFVAPLYVDPSAKKFISIIRSIYIPDREIIDSNKSFTSTLDGGSNLASLIVRLKRRNPDQFSRFQKIIKKLLPNVISFEDIDISPQVDRPAISNSEEYLVLFQEKNIESALSMQALSFGDLKTLYLIALVVGKENGTVIVEEIENGMHPKRGDDLVDCLDTIARTKNIQIVFTSHSPSIINKMRVSDVIYVSKNEASGSIFEALRDNIRQGQIEALLADGGSITDVIQ